MNDDENHSERDDRIFVGSEVEEDPKSAGPAILSRLQKRRRLKNIENAGKRGGKIF